MGFAAPSLKGRALRLLSQREHSRAELQRKLARHEQVAGELAQALDALAARGFIDESRVVDSVVRRRSGRLGALRIRQEWQAKGVPADTMAGAIAALQASEPARAAAVWRQKFGDAVPAGPAGHARQARFLAARGFSGATIARVLRGGPPDDDVLSLPQDDPA